jgi:DNA excision repair protein ERCC-5
MGVLNLWKILSLAGQKVDLEIMRDQILAIDISIWLNQIIKAVPAQNEDDSTNNDVFMKPLFHRIMTLLYFGCKPVFIFDGKTPELKLETIVKKNLN